MKTERLHVSGAARRHRGRDRQGADEFLVVVWNSAARHRPVPLSIEIGDQGTRNQVWIERVDAVAHGAEDDVQRGAPDDQFKRLLVNDRQRIPNGR